MGSVSGRLSSNARESHSVCNNPMRLCDAAVHSILRHPLPVSKLLAGRPEPFDLDVDGELKAGSWM